MPDDFPGAYTELAWIEIPSGSEGAILGFANATPLGTASGSQAQVWIDGDGYVVVASVATSPGELASNSPVADGSWHLIEFTSDGSSAALYVDGVLQQSATLAGTSSSGDGRWSVGAASFAGSTAADPPTTSSGVSYLSGAIAGLAVIPRALSPSETAALAGAATFATYAGDVGSYDPLHAWMLQDQAPTIDANLPDDSVEDVCGSVPVTVSWTFSANTTCLEPPESAGTGCPTITAGGTLGDLMSSESDAPSAIPARSAAQIAIVLGAALGLPSDLYGAEVVATVAVGASNGPWSVQASFPGSETDL
jgi:hypothetical protein